jgi:hypothetical protein
MNMKFSSVSEKDLKDACEKKTQKGKTWAVALACLLVAAADI